MTTVRPIRRSDVAAVVAMAERFHAASPVYSVLPFSRRKVAEHVSWPFTHPHARAWFVVERDGDLIGALGVRVVGANCSEAMIGLDDGFWVEPSARGALVGKRLVRECEAWAKAHGAVLMGCAITAGLDPEGRTARMFDLLGFGRGGTTHFKGL